MNSSIDLNLLLLARQGTNLTSETPDLYAVTPPRHTARGRESDRLIIYMSMTGNSPLSSEAQSQLLEQLAHKFYKTPGSLTAALRTIVEALNLYLLDRNLRSTSMGRQGIGQLQLVALRADNLYLAHSGTVHAFVVTATGTQHLYDPQSSGRGLGFSRTTPIRFLQTTLAAGDFLVLATSAPANWTEETIKHPASQGVEELRKRLLESSKQDFNAVIIQAQPGAGKLHILRRKAEMPEETHAEETQQPTGVTEAAGLTPLLEAIERPVDEQVLETEGELARAKVVTEPEIENKVEIAPVSMAGEETADEKVEGIASGDSSSLPVETGISPVWVDETTPAAPPPGLLSEATASQEVKPSEPSTSTEGPVSQAEFGSGLSTPVSRPRRTRGALKPAPWAKSIASLKTGSETITRSILGALRNALGTIGAATLRLLKNLLPDADVLHLPPSLLVFLAIAIPVILAGVGGWVFLQRGRAQQNQVYYEQALEQVDAAAKQTDPLKQRLALQAALEDLDNAEYYTSTSQAQELRTKVVTQLDTLDAVKRLDYKQAIVGGLDATVNVIRLIATTTDLYLLNGNQGNVLHAIMTGRGYEIDPNFQCGPTQGPIHVGPLVDMVELPPGAFENASVLGMDARGNLLYCVVGAQPYSASMAPPNTGFGEPSGLSLDQGDLYVLDSKVNAVWIYRNMEVTQQPHLFFGDTVPPMQDVIDLVVYNDDLFLLHADGHITKCVYSAMPESPTRCDDPYPYSDNRPGRTHGPVIADAVFNQIFFSSFPERSLYMLDPQNQSIFYFSVLMTLQWQYQPRATLVAGNASAFAISPNRMAFLAIGSNVYYAAIP